jgi:hypothetical protein
MTTSMSKPSMPDIKERQADDLNVRRQLAARAFYRRGKYLHFLGLSVAVGLAAAAPVVLLFAPNVGPTLGAVAGVWLFVSRFILERFKSDYQLKGAKAQELFDCNVLGVGWNDALAKPMSEEEIRQASPSLDGGDFNWYPADGQTSWPLSVLVCQRSNANWARRQHQAYGSVLFWAVVAWFVVGVAVATAHEASLGEYLTTVLLPSLPALLDGVEMSEAHKRAAARRELLEDRTDALLKRHQGGLQELREIQDQLFDLRREAPLVPEWFYKIIKPKYEESMRYAAAQLGSAPPNRHKEGD